MKGFKGFLFQWAKWSFLPLCLVAQTAQAQVGLDFLAQQSIWQIEEGSEQESATQTGAYFYFPLGSWAYAEGSHDETTIEFKTADPFERGDNALVLSVLAGPSTLYGGQHWVSTETEIFDEAKSNVFGVELFDILGFTLRYEAYRTEYPNLAWGSDPADVGLEVRQSSPMLGLSLFEGSLDLEYQQDKSERNDSLGYDSTEAVSTRQALRFTFFPWRLYVSQWSGERMFFASSKGLYLNSLPYLYTGGTQAALTYYGFGWLHLGYTHTTEEIQETPGADSLSATIDTLSLTLRF